MEGGASSLRAVDESEAPGSGERDSGRVAGVGLEDAAPEATPFVDGGVLPSRVVEEFEAPGSGERGWGRTAGVGIDEVAALGATPLTFLFLNSGEPPVWWLRSGDIEERRFLELTMMVGGKLGGPVAPLSCYIPTVHT